MTQKEYNELVYKINNFISNIIYIKNIPCYLRQDKYGNTLWKLTFADLKLNLCIISYSNIKSVTIDEMVIPMQIKTDRDDILDLFSDFKCKDKYFIKGYDEMAMRRLKTLFKRLIKSTKKNIINKNIVSLN